MKTKVEPSRPSRHDLADAERFRVRIRIKDRSVYAAGAADSLNGQLGTVRVHNHEDQMWLVEFDQPIKSWWHWGSDVTAFWFEECDLERL